MITYLDYTLVPLPCPRTQHSRLFLSWKPLTLKIRSSAIPFLWKRVNNMFQRDWKVIFFFYQKPFTSKLPSTVRSKQTLCLHRKWPELPDQDWNPDFSIWSPALQTRGDHNSHVTWSSLHWKKKVGASTHLLMVPGSYWTERWRCFYRRRWQQRLGKYILHVETMQSVPILSEVQIR